MLTKAELAGYCRRLNLSPVAIRTINAIRGADPSRNPQGGRDNVVVAFSSRKMMLGIKAESHTLEFAFLIDAEYRSDVYEMWDQPPTITLTYDDRQGHSRSSKYTPDFFILREGWAGWVECKKTAELARLAVKAPNRYALDEDGRWRCPPAESYAAQVGLQFQIVSSDQISRVAHRNLLYLENYLRHRDELDIDALEAQKVIRVVEASPGLSLEDLLQRAEARPDTVFSMCARGFIYIPLNKALLVERHAVQVYRDEPTAFACAITPPSANEMVLASRHAFRAVAGASVVWDEVLWTIANVGARSVTLLLADGSSDNRVFELTRQVFDKLVVEGSIIGESAPEGTRLSAAGRVALQAASPTDLQLAARRVAIARGDTVESDDPPPAVSPRSARRYRQQLREGDVAHGMELVGVLPKRKNGGRGPQIPEEVRALIHEVLREYYDTPANRIRRGAYGELVARCEERSLRPPCEKTFYRHANKHLGAYEQARRRLGTRGAYAVKEFAQDQFHAQLPHQRRAWENAYIDHTELDLQVVSSVTGKSLGRPWITVMQDDATRSVLALDVSFDPPSYRSCLAIVRECVRRHGRLPDRLSVDNGAEFRSVYFQQLAAQFEVTLAYRPPAQPRFGAPIERFFGRLTTEVIDHMLGNTQMTHHKRQVTKATDPLTHACWTLESLLTQLETYAYAVYDTLVHLTLGQSPRDARQQSLERDGARPHMRIPYDDDFLIATMPSTPKGRAMVRPGRGITIHGFHYRCPAMRANPEVEYLSVPVRYDPSDISIAYAYFGGLWHLCRCNYFAELAGCSERELQVLTRELRRQLSVARGRRVVSITLKQLVIFRRSNQQIEAVLMQQMRDLETKKALRSRGGGPVIIGSEEARELLPASSGEDDAVEADESPATVEEQERPLPLIRLGRFLG